MKSIAVILIDCWDSTDSKEQKIRDSLFQNIIVNISKLDNLKIVIKSSYDVLDHTPNKSIHNYNWSVPSVEVHTTHDLRNFLINNKIHIDNFILMGMHWDRCLMNRDLGWKSLLKSFPNNKVFVVSDCMLALDNHKKQSYWPNLNNDDRCIHFENNFYQIIG